MKHRETDEAVVERARRVLAQKPRMHWAMLLCAFFFLGFAGYCTLVGIRKIEGFEGEQLRAGFLNGLGMAVIWTSFGLIGAMCLGKFMAGLTDDFRAQELLVRYHDRLRDLAQLPDEKSHGQ